MNLKKIYDCLCAKDMRSPLWFTLYGYGLQYGDTMQEVRRTDCSCDACFYGQDELARELLKAKGMREEYPNTLQLMPPREQGTAELWTAMLNKRIVAQGTIEQVLNQLRGYSF